MKRLFRDTPLLRKPPHGFLVETVGITRPTSMSGAGVNDNRLRLGKLPDETKISHVNLID